LDRFEVTLIGKKSSGANLYLDEKGRRIYGNWCVECKLFRQAEIRAANGNAATKAYEKTPHGFLVRLYRNMKSRITGVQKEKHHLYVGKSLLSKKDFYSWAEDHPDFKKLFAVYKKSGFEQKLAPTVDRQDSSKGYELPNMEWVTHSENSRRGTISRFSL
jgi:hypothetical protein